MTGRLAKTRCDACHRYERRCEQLIRGGMEIWVCVEWRNCNAAQPPLRVLLGRTA